MSAEASEGVFFLANDAIAPWVRSFVRSFRLHNPHLPLCLIPFDDSASACRALVAAADGTVLDDETAFQRLERIGSALELGYTTYGRHWFRRYVAFQGPFERFLYLDARMVVLSDLRPILRTLTTTGIDVLHFDASLNQVYRQGPLRTEFVCRGGGHGFFSGMWATRRGLFTMAHMEEAGVELATVRNQMNNRNTDQFFINYLCDTHRVRMAHYADLDEEVAHVCWAGDGSSVYRDTERRWRKWAFGQPDHRQIVPFVHWAGFRLSRAMPLHHLHERFQTANYGLTQRALGAVAAIPGRCLQALRRNRLLNTLYHRMRSRR